MSSVPTDQIRADFDRIAQADTAQRSADSREMRYLLGRLPERVGAVLEIGCGVGNLATALADRAERVTAFDLSPEMIRVARERSAARPNIEFFVADAMTWTYPEQTFDAVVSLATLHHMPLDEVLEKVKGTLKPGGVFISVDLYEPDATQKLMRRVRSKLRRMFPWLFKQKQKRQRDPQAAAAWAAHWEHNDEHPYLRDVRRLAAGVLPGAKVKPISNLWFALEWRKP